MSRVITTFDYLGCFDKLKKAGFPEEQTKLQETVLRNVIHYQNAYVLRSCFSSLARIF